MESETDLANRDKLTNKQELPIGPEVAELIFDSLEGILSELDVGYG